jgi:hypothetical protein
MRLEGALSSSDAESLAQRLRDSLARSKNRLVLDLNKLHWDKVDDLRPIWEKLAAYRSRIRLVLPKLAAAHPGDVTSLFRATPVSPTFIGQARISALHQYGICELKSLEIRGRFWHPDATRADEECWVSIQALRLAQMRSEGQTRRLTR